jgi:hypothetical protein
LLHPEFHEVGRSGRMYNRGSIMELLATQDSQFEVVSDNYTVSELSAGMALLTYLSAHIDQSNVFQVHGSMKQHESPRRPTGSVKKHNRVNQMPENTTMNESVPQSAVT